MSKNITPFSPSPGPSTKGGEYLQHSTKCQSANRFGVYNLSFTEQILNFTESPGPDIDHLVGIFRRRLGLEAIRTIDMNQFRRVTRDRVNFSQAAKSFSGISRFLPQLAFRAGQRLLAGIDRSGGKFVKVLFDGKTILAQQQRLSFIQNGNDHHRSRMDHDLRRRRISVGKNQFFSDQGDILFFELVEELGIGTL